MSTISSQLITGGGAKSREDFLNLSVLKLGQDKNWRENPDVIFLIPDEEHIGIDKIRDFQKTIGIKPTIFKTKIGIITQADLLTVESQNALLKTLEEPPDNTAIFLLCQDENSLLETILSRCQLTRLGTEISLVSEEDRTPLREELEALLSDQTQKKFEFASQSNSDRQLAISHLDQLLIFIHNEKETRQTIPELVRAILKTKKRLRANCHVRLAIENLFLNWYNENVA